MKQSKTTGPALERLETRWCPSTTGVSATEAHGTLKVTADQVGSDDAVSLSITATSANSFTVTNNSSPVGGANGNGQFTDATSLTIDIQDTSKNAASHSDAVFIDLGGTKLAGNLTIALGTKHNLALNNQVTVIDGEIGEQLHITGSHTTDSVTLGSTAAQTLKVDRDAYINEGSSQSDTVEIKPGATLAQHFTAYSTNIFKLDANSSVEGGLDISGGSLQHQVTIAGDVQSNKGNSLLSFIGSNHGDTFTLASSAAVDNLFVQLGNASFGTPNTVDIGGTIGNASALGTLNQNGFKILGGAGIDQAHLEASATINAKLTANLGAGADLFTLKTGVSIANVRGDVVNGGPGQDTFKGTSLAPMDLKIEHFETRDPNNP